MRIVFASLVLAIGAHSVAAQALSGVKTVGGIDPDYATLVDAVNELNVKGVAAGGVTFHIRPGEYAGPLSVTQGNEQSPVVFRHDPDVPGVVKITAPGPEPVWKFSPGVSHVTLDGLTIHALNQDGIQFLDFSQNCIIKKCDFVVESTSGGVIRAILCKGSGIAVVGNRIKLTAVNHTAIGITVIGQGVVQRNTVDSSGPPYNIGIQLYSGNFVVSNNIVFGTLAQGLRIDGGSHEAYHNTIIGNTNTPLIRMYDPGTLWSRNNILISQGGYCYEADIWTLNSNYNLFFTSQLARVGATSFANLQKWASETGMDQNSVSEDPKLDQGMLTVGSPARGKGVEIAEVVIDIEEEPRPIGAQRDIGADEFLHPAPDQLAAVDPLGFQARFNAVPGSFSTRVRIQVSTQESFETLVWDSNPDLTVTGGGFPNLSSVPAGQACSAIPYAGPALSGGTTYYWRIRFWDDFFGEPTSWSDAAKFMTKSAAVATASESADSSAGGGGCGCLGLEILLPFALVGLLRRRRRVSCS